MKLESLDFKRFFEATSVPFGIMNRIGISESNYWLTVV